MKYNFEYGGRKYSIQSDSPQHAQQTLAKVYGINTKTVQVTEHTRGVAKKQTPRKVVALPELNREQKTSLRLKEIAQRVRIELANELPNCKFSVSTKYYAGGQSLAVGLMSCSGTKIIKDFKDIDEMTLFKYANRRYDAEQIKHNQEKKYHQLNHYTLNQDYNPGEWCNGVFLTMQGHNLLRKVVQIVEAYNWDRSDISTDYFDVHFYTNYSIGKWDKDFVQM